MKRTFVVRDGELVEKTARRAGKSWQVLSDIEPFLAPGGEWIGSRSELHAYEKKYGVRQLGNDWPGSEKPAIWDQVKRG